jgi:hypothetical protein
VVLLADLERGLRFEPPETRLRQVARAEHLVREIADDAEYDAAWVIEQLTGFRPDQADGMRIAGAHLRAGVVVFIERQTALAGASPGDIPDALDVPALLDRWKISRATLGRLRPLGLVAWRVREKGTPGRILFPLANVEWFERERSGVLPCRPRPTRISDEEARRLHSLARRYQRRLRWPVTRIIRRLAERSGRSAEGVRKALLRHEARAGGPPLFPRTPVLRAREGRGLREAWRLGFDIGLLARRVNRSRSAVRRAIAVARAELLARLLPPGQPMLEGPTFRLPGADEAILAPPAVREGLGEIPPLSIRAMFEEARGGTTPLPAARMHRSVAYHFLRWRAASIVAGLDHLHPSPVDLDRAETDLRWALRIKGAMIRAEFPLLLRTLESRIGAPLEQHVPPRLLPSLILDAIGALAVAVDQFDPFRGGRFPAPAGLALDRAALDWLKRHPAPHEQARRAAVVLSDAEVLPDWTLRLTRRQHRLEPHPAVRRAAMRDLPDPERASFLRRRFGWGGPPHTLDELAPLFALTPVRAPLFESAALREARAALP